MTNADYIRTKSDGGLASFICTIQNEGFCCGESGDETTLWTLDEWLEWLRIERRNID